MFQFVCLLTAYENRGVEQSVNVFSRDTCEKNRAAGLLQPMHVFLALALTTSPATHKHDVHAQQKATPNETTSRSYCVELQINILNTLDTSVAHSGSTES